MYILLAIIGALSNRIRGGLIGPYVDWLCARLPGKTLPMIVGRLLDGDTINAVAFACAVALVPTASYTGMVDGVPYYELHPDWVTGFFAGLAMFAGAAPGWGRYIGALAGDVTNDLREQPMIDKFITRFLDRPRLWGFAGLTLRGGLWGFLISLALHSLWPLIGGLLMGCVYWLVIKISGGSKRGWPLSEWLFGPVLWVMI